MEGWGSIPVVGGCAFAHLVQGGAAALAAAHLARAAARVGALRQAEGPEGGERAQQRVEGGRGGQEAHGPAVQRPALLAAAGARAGAARAAVGLQARLHAARGVAARARTVVAIVAARVGRGARQLTVAAAARTAETTPCTTIEEDSGQNSCLIAGWATGGGDS